MTERKGAYRVVSKFAARKDANHNQIVEGLELHGFPVIETYRQGDGCPDCFAVNASGQWVALEIKGPRGKLTPMEKSEHDRVFPAPWYVVRNLEQALEAMHTYDEYPD